MRCGGGKIWHHCKSDTQFMDFFTKGETVSDGFSLMLVTNSTFAGENPNKLLQTHCCRRFTQTMWRAYFNIYIYIRGVSPLNGGSQLNWAT